MPTPRKDTDKLSVRLEVPLIEELKRLAESSGKASYNAFAADIIRDKLAELSGRKEKFPATAPHHVTTPDIDLRALLLESHKTIAELTKTISALVESQGQPRSNPARSAAHATPAETERRPRRVHYGREDVGLVSEEEPAP